MSKQTEISVYLKLHNFPYPAAHITALTGISPSEAWDKGDSIPRRREGTLRTSSSWILTSDADKHDKQLDSPLQLIADKKEIIGRLAADCFSELTIVIRSYEESNTGFCIDKVRLKRVSQYRSFAGCG